MDSTSTTKKRQNSDFTTLAKMLGCSYAAAKMRFYRQNEDAMEMMLKIIEAKKSLINENSPKEGNPFVTGASKTHQKIITEFDSHDHGPI